VKLFFGMRSRQFLERGNFADAKSFEERLDAWLATSAIGTTFIRIGGRAPANRWFVPGRWVERDDGNDAVEPDSAPVRVSGYGTSAGPWPGRSNFDSLAAHE
jgi:hypothetical protein